MEQQAGQAARIERGFAARWMGLAGLAVALSMLGLAAGVLYDARRTAWQRAEQASRNLAIALERDIARNFAVIDLSVRGAIEALQEPSLQEASPAVRHMALFDRASSAEHLGSLMLLNADGESMAASTTLARPELSFADRDYFEVHREHPDAGLFLSRPFRSRLRGGDPSMAVSRRITQADGGFGGVVVGTLRLAYFQDLFARLDLGHRGSVTLLRADGRVLARHPFREADLDRDLSGSEGFQRVLRSSAGSFVAEAPLDGVRRLYAFRHIDNLPLVISVAVAADDIMADWWGKALALGAILMVLGGATLVLCFLFRREILRRGAAERRLAQSAQALEVAATTDGLTGLANRRQLDAVLEREGRRAAREQMPLSVLLLDVDRFKSYNDRYGHQAGDECLRVVAGAVAASVNRPGDLVARYGGEELAVVLPATDEAGALHIAERVRAAVEGAGLTHEGNTECGAVVTVSVGCASALPAPDGSSADVRRLLKQADKALYGAKHGGRNRVAAHAAIPTSPVPPALPEEEKRLSALAGLGGAEALGAGPAKGALDRLARLTAGLMGAPVAFISLVERDRQVLIGRHGIDLETSSRDTSFCAHTIAGDGLLVVPDATSDPRFAGNPFVTGGPRIRFYAGAPLITPAGGHRLGTLCIVGHEPRWGLDAAEQVLLTNLARLAILELEEARLAA